ncbi:hypothetical protein ES708_31489 [subsurface metagenome]
MLKLLWFKDLRGIENNDIIVKFSTGIGVEDQVIGLLGDLIYYLKIKNTKNTKNRQKERAKKAVEGV